MAILSKSVVFENVISPRDVRLLALVTLSATIRTTVKLGDEFQEGEISFVLSLQRKTSCLTPFHSTTLGPQRSKSAWSGPPELGESSDNGHVIASSYCSRRSDHRVNPGAGELSEIADLHPIVLNERPKNVGILG